MPFTGASKFLIHSCIDQEPARGKRKLTATSSNSSTEGASKHSCLDLEKDTADGAARKVNRKKTELFAKNTKAIVWGMQLR